MAEEKMENNSHLEYCSEPDYCDMTGLCNIDFWSFFLQYKLCSYPFYSVSHCTTACNFHVKSENFRLFKIPAMYYLLRSQQPEKPKESPLPKTGKIFLFLFFLFHVVFLGFNFYYFVYYTADEAGEEKAIDIDALAEAADPPIDV